MHSGQCSIPFNLSGHAQLLHASEPNPFPLMFKLPAPLGYLEQRMVSISGEGDPAGMGKEKHNRAIDKS